MVSFSCEACGDVLTKKKLDPHRSRCHGASFTCLDCMVHFTGVQYRSHTSCISEDQKYQGALYKGKTKAKNNKPSEQRPIEPPPKSASAMALQPYVEDVGEDRDYEPWNDTAPHTEDERSLVEPPPEAPTPPAAATEEHVNVFDFLVATGQTPNASNMNLARDQPGLEGGHSTSLVRYEYGPDNYLDPTSLMEADDEPLVQYGTGPVPVGGSFVTPAPKSERRKTKDGEAKKDKKRKRLHLHVPADQVMTDAPPVLHSGLTGGLKSLMRPALPPSPDYSGGDVADNSPASPLKKTKHAKHSKNGQMGNSILDMITGGSKTKTHKKKPSKKHSHRRREHKEPKLIEFRPQSKDGKRDHPGDQIIVFKPRADAFLGFVTKGPDSERGCSVNKALKRYHRERQASGSSATKSKEEKELWKDLRLRRNDRGEIVLFSL